MERSMLFQILKFFFDMSVLPQWLYITFVVNMWLGILLGILACINWFGTDRSEELYHAINNGYSPNPADLVQLNAYASRADAFAIHVFLAAFFGALGTIIAKIFVKIPPEP